MFACLVEKRSAQGNREQARSCVTERDANETSTQPMDTRSVRIGERQVKDHTQKRNGWWAWDVAHFRLSSHDGLYIPLEAMDTQCWLAHTIRTDVPEETNGTVLQIPRSGIGTRRRDPCERPSSHPPTREILVSTRLWMREAGCEYRHWTLSDQSMTMGDVEGRPGASGQFSSIGGWHLPPAGAASRRDHLDNDIPRTYPWRHVRADARVARRSRLASRHIRNTRNVALHAWIRRKSI